MLGHEGVYVGLLIERLDIFYDPPTGSGKEFMAYEEQLEVEEGRRMEMISASSTNLRHSFDIP